MPLGPYRAGCDGPRVRICPGQFVSSLKKETVTMADVVLRSSKSARNVQLLCASSTVAPRAGAHKHGLARAC